MILRFTTLLLILTAALSSAIGQEFAATYTTELQHDFDGEVNWVNLLALKLSLPTEALKLWQGGSIDLTTISIYRTSEERIINDLMTFSNIDEANIPISPFVLGYQHKTKRIRLFAGMRNLNEDYFIAPYSSGFTNSSCGIYPTISCNFPCPNYPLSAMGIVFDYYFLPNFIYSNSLYNGVSRNIWNAGWNTFTINPHRDGILNAGELAYHNPHRLRGDYYLGALFHTGYLDPQQNYRRTHFNYTTWFVAEQQFYNNQKRSAGLLLQGSWAPNWNYCHSYIGIGIILKGLLTRNHREQLSIVTNMAQFSDTQEYATEITFTYSLTQQITLQSSFQLISTYGKLYPVLQLRGSYNLNFDLQRKKI